MRRLRGAIAIAAVIIVLVAFTLLSSSTDAPSATGTPPPPGRSTVKGYATAICNGMAAWSRSLDAQGKTLNADLETAASLDDVKAAVLTYFDQVIVISETEASEAEALAPPDVSAGEEAHAAIVNSLRSNITSFQTARATVEALGPADGDLTAAIQAINKDLRAELTDESVPLTGFRDAGLNDAFEAESACKEFV